ncbi:MAG: TonB-dependent receptor [Mariniphaga sp.]|nr:TonB-dependent receptor [Mariniphaga sp.]
MFFPLISLAQQRFTLSGYLHDATSGEALIYATIYPETLKTGVSTNEYGFFSITLPEGKYNVVFSYVGYQTIKKEIPFDKNLHENISLSPQETNIKEITIIGHPKENLIRQNEIGTVRLDVKELSTIPVLFGEQDILKSIQLMPGVSPVGEGNSGFYVRGGNPDQNLILLDDAPVFNPSHLLGFFSVFNSDVIRDVKLYKGGVPARYGGRASSVMDIRMKEGNLKDYHVSGGIGLISSRLMAEGPISQDKSSFMISGRRTYADLFLPLSNDEKIKDNKLYFYDLNLKTNLIINKNNRVFLSGYFGRDVLQAKDFGFSWGNKAGSLRWNHQFSPSLFANTTMVINDYNYKTEGDIDGKFSLEAGINDLSLKQDYALSLFNHLSFLFGFNSVLHHFKPGEVMSSSKNIQSFKISEKDGWENAIYAFLEHQISEKLNVGYGIRMSTFSRIAPGTENTYNTSGSIAKTETFDSGKFYRNYFGFEPRFNLTWLISDQSSIKAGYNRMSQYIHLLSNSSVGTPVDYWLPSSNNIKPQFISQISAGYFRQFKSNGINFSVEGYYKDMENQIDYRNNADVFLNENAEAELLFGKGRSYGLEFLCKKDDGIFTGWISYTLSRTEKRFDEINDGSWYPARQDRTHDISIVTNLKAGKKLSLSATWVYYTGNAITFPSGKYEIDDNIVNYYTSRNGYRMPAYHRLDLGASLLLKETPKFRSELSFGVFNAYGRKNAYSISFQTKEGNSSQTEAVKLYLFSVIPSVTWNFRF